MGCVPVPFHEKVEVVFRYGRSWTHEATFWKKSQFQRYWGGGKLNADSIVAYVHKRGKTEPRVLIGYEFRRLGRLPRPLCRFSILGIDGSRGSIKECDDLETMDPCALKLIDQVSTLGLATSAGIIGGAGGEWAT